MFCNFAAIAAVLFEDRLGCLENEMDAEVQSFIKAVAQMFETGHQLMVFATLHKRLGTKVWKTHVESWDTIYRIGKSHNIKICPLLHPKIQYDNFLNKFKFWRKFFINSSFQDFLY